MSAVENAELLALDALAGSAPQVWCVLTTRTATIETARFYESRRQVVRALRRRWPAVEYAALVEFTTGYGSNSGGHRRPHWNLLLKGIPGEDVDQVADVVRRVWCDREDATPDGQHVGRVGEFGGLMRYVALHFQKESQAPPAGWRGHRFLKSRGYLATTTPEAREAARASLRHKRELWRAIGRGLTGLEAEEAAQAAIALAEATTWRVIDVTRTLTVSTRGADSLGVTQGAVLPGLDAAASSSSAAAPVVSDALAVSVSDREAGAAAEDCAAAGGCAPPTPARSPSVLSFAGAAAASAPPTTLRGPSVAWAGATGPEPRSQSALPEAHK